MYADPADLDPDPDAQGLCADPDPSASGSYVPDLGMCECGWGGSDVRLGLRCRPILRPDSVRICWPVCRVTCSVPHGLADGWNAAQSPRLADLLVVWLPDWCDSGDSHWRNHRGIEAVAVGRARAYRKLCSWRSALIDPDTYREPPWWPDGRGTVRHLWSSRRTSMCVDLLQCAKQGHQLDAVYRLKRSLIKVRYRPEADIFIGSRAGRTA